MNHFFNKSLLLFIGLFLVTGEAFAQKTFYRTVGHQTEGSEGRNVIQSADGGYFMSYYIYIASEVVAVLAKFNCAGEKDWERFYDGGIATIPMQLIPQPDNGCLFSISVQNQTGSWQQVVNRISASGNTTWTKRLNMRAANTTGCMVQHNDGSIYICGSVEVASTGFNGTSIVKMNAFGQMLWEKHYSELIDHVPRGITVTSDHKVVVVGQVGIPTFLFTNIFIFMVDEDGNFIKRKILTTTYDDEALSICADIAGNIGISGYSYFLGTQWDMMFLKLDGQLNLLHSKFYDLGTPQGEQARYIIASDDYTFTIFGDEGGFNERNPMMMQLDTDGNILWAKHYTISPQYTNYIFYGAQCNDGGFLMTGDARPVTQFRIAPFIKTNAIGDMGCFTSPVSMTVRNETFITLDTSLLEFPIIVNSDTTGIPFSGLSMSTSNTAFCQSLIPCGNISWSVDTLCPIPCFTFSQTSLLADSWQWTFENGIPSSSGNQQPPVVCYTTPGPHKVELTMANVIGSVTLTEFVYPQFDCPFIIPNIITPDGDGLNDVFMVKGISSDFTLKIFNRWGLEIFNADYPGKWWNGNSEGNVATTSGVYFYLLSLKNGKRFQGTIQVLRK